MLGVGDPAADGYGKISQAHFSLGQQFSLAAETAHKAADGAAPQALMCRVETKTAKV